MDDDEPDSMLAESAPPKILRDARGRVRRGGAVLNPKGRPKGSGARPRLADIARKLVKKRGGSLEDWLEQVLESVHAKAVAGDMNAARLLCERLSTSEDAELQADKMQFLASPSAGPPLPDPETMRARFEDLSQLHALLGECTTVSQKNAVYALSADERYRRYLELQHRKYLELPPPEPGGLPAVSSEPVRSITVVSSDGAESCERDANARPPA